LKAEQAYFKKSKKAPKSRNALNTKVSEEVILSDLLLIYTISLVPILPWTPDVRALRPPPLKLRTGAVRVVALYRIVRFDHVVTLRRASTRRRTPPPPDWPEYPFLCPFIFPADFSSMRKRTGVRPPVLVGAAQTRTAHIPVMWAVQGLKMQMPTVPPFILFDGVQPMESILGIRLGHFR